jgi:hypothetical protein
MFLEAGHNVLQDQLHYKLNMTYAELVTKIRDYTEVDSNVFTATIVNGFILDAEWRIQRDVDSDNNRKYATASIIAGQPYVSTPLLTDQTLIIREAQILYNGEYYQIEYRDTGFINEYNNTQVQGIPKYFSYWDEQNIVLAPIPDLTYTMQLNYTLKPAGLSASNTTTYLSQQFPSGLLYACLVEAYGFLKGPADMIQFYEQKYQSALQGFSIEQMGRRRRDEFQEGSPQIQKQG